MAYADKYVHQESDMPEGTHWAILKFSTHTVSGDERSRTHPGHGYPAHVESVVTYEAYYTEEAWKDAIRELETTAYSTPSYRAVVVTPAIVTRDVKVDVS